MKTPSFFRRALLAGVVACSFGCDFNVVAVDTTAGVLVAAQDSTRAYFDWESAGPAAASGIMQLEGLHKVSPDNEELSLILVKAYIAYAYGWVMDAHEVAADAGNEELAAHHKERAHLMYSRARDIAMRVLDNRDEHFSQMSRKDPQTFRAYLKHEFDDPEEDLAPLFWLMMSWSAAVNNSATMDEFVDMPAIRTIAAYVAEIDETYEDGGALVFMGGFDSSYPKALGGDPVKGKKYFERAIELTQRHNHVYLINYAMLYAVNAQDKALFLSLLHEVIDAGDQGPRNRLPNKVAKRRALRYLARADMLFN